jgi:hypothetical protein
LKFKRRQIEDKMGLDQYAYVASRAQQKNDFYEGAEYDDRTQEFVNPTVTKPREIAYWRKHPNLQGWMEQLWISKGGVGDFNGDEVELTWEDLERLEQDIKSQNLPSTSGFFFGDNSDQHYYNEDLQFVFNAKAEVFCGLKVFYNSSW